MILDLLRRKTPSDNIAESLTLMSADGWPREDDSSTSSAMKISAVNSCVEIISNTVAKLPWFILDETSKKRVNDHYLGHVLWERPNEMMSPFDFEKYVTQLVLCAGNCYVWNYRDGAGRTVERIPLPPGMCFPYFDPSIGKWCYIATEPKTHKQYRLDPTDVSHYKMYTEDGVTGISVLRRAAKSIEVAKLAERYEREMYRTGGRPSGTLQTDADLGGTVKVKKGDNDFEEISKKEQVRRAWDKVHAGPDNAFKVAVLDHGLKYQPIDMMSPADAKLVESKSVSIADICRFFCVPANKLGEGKQSYASNEQNDLEFLGQTIQPIVTQREQENTYKLLTLSERQKFNLRCRMNMDAALRSDAKSRAEVERIYRDTGVYSVNDICDIEDRPSVPGGDTRYASLNFVPLEMFKELALAKQRGASNEE